MADVLLAEDNEDDIILTRQSFKTAKLLVNLHTVANGKECMAFLRNQHPYENAPKIDLMLLDLNMPVMDGREVLEAINADKTLQHLPVVVLTICSAEADILKMYKLRCNSYIVKPVKYERFVEVIRTLGAYWLTVSVLPAVRLAASPDSDR